MSWATPLKRPGESRSSGLWILWQVRCWLTRRCATARAITLSAKRERWAGWRSLPQAASSSRKYFFSTGKCLAFAFLLLAVWYVLLESYSPIFAMPFLQRIRLRQDLSAGQGRGKFERQGAPCRLRHAHPAAFPGHLCLQLRRGGLAGVSVRAAGGRVPGQGGRQQHARRPQRGQAFGGAVFYENGVGLPRGAAGAVPRLTGPALRQPQRPRAGLAAATRPACQRAAGAVDSSQGRRLLEGSALASFEQERQCAKNKWRL